MLSTLSDTMQSLRVEALRLRSVLRAVRGLERSPDDETVWGLQVRRAKVIIWCVLNRSRFRPPNVADPRYLPSHIASPERTQIAALNLQFYLTKLGFPVTCCGEIPEKMEGTALVCPQVFGPTERYSVALQLEQLRCSRWLSPFYLEQLALAERVVDFSTENIELLQRLGFAETRLRRLELKPVPRGHLVVEADLTQDPDSEEFLLFYGSISDRRRAALDELSRVAPVRIVSDLSREALWKLVYQSKAVVNIHFYPCASTEAVRIAEILTIGTPVISEDAADLSRYSWSHLIDTFPLGDWHSLRTKAQDLLAKDGSIFRRAAITDWIRRNSEEPSH